MLTIKQVSAVTVIAIIVFYSIYAIAAGTIEDTANQKRFINGNENDSQGASLTSYATQPYQVATAIVGTSTSVYTRYKSGTSAQFIKRSQNTNSIVTYTYATTNWADRATNAITWLPING